MAKVAITLFAVLFLIVASTYAQEEPSIWKCVDQAMEADLTPCDKFLIGEDIKMITDKSKQSHKSLDKCCNAMQKLDQECQCKAVEAGHEGISRLEGKEMRQQALQKLETVISHCNLPRDCEYKY